MAHAPDDPGHLIRHGHYATAMAVLCGMVQDQPDAAAAWTTLGVCYVETGHVREGVKAFMRALRIEDGAPETLEALGCAWLRRGDTVAARDWFHRALEVSNTGERRASILHHLSGALHAEGRHSAARFVLEEAREACVDDSEWERATGPFASRFLDRFETAGDRSSDP